MTTLVAALAEPHDIDDLLAAEARVRRWRDTLALASSAEIEVTEDIVIIDYWLDQVQYGYKAPLEINDSVGQDFTNTYSTAGGFSRAFADGLSASAAVTLGSRFFITTITADGADICTATTVGIGAGAEEVPIYTVAPVLSGTPEQGQDLTITPGTAIKTSAVVSTKWQIRDAATDAIIRAGLTAAQGGLTYRQTAADVTKILIAKEYKTLASGGVVGKYSNSVGPVAVPSGSTVVTGAGGDAAIAIDVAVGVGIGTPTIHAGAGASASTSPSTAVGSSTGGGGAIHYGYFPTGMTAKDLTGYTVRGLKTYYGAVGNGTADDTAKIQAAWNGLGPSIALDLEEGEYAYTKPIIANTKSGFVIFGRGADKTIFKPITPPFKDAADPTVKHGFSALIFTSCHHFALQDFSMRGFNQTGVRSNDDGGKGIFIKQTCYGFRLNNILIDSISGSQFFFGGARGYGNLSTSGGIDPNPSTVSNCTGQNSRADTFHVTYASNNLTFSNLYAYNSGDDSFTTIGLKTNLNRHINWYDCKSEDSYWGGGAAMEGCDDCHHYRTIIYRSGIAGLRFSSLPASPSVTGAVSNCSYTDCEANGCVTRGQTNTGGDYSLSAYSSNESIASASFIRCKVQSPFSGGGARIVEASPIAGVTVAATFTNCEFTDLSGLPFKTGGSATVNKSGNTNDGLPA